MNIHFGNPMKLLAIALAALLALVVVLFGLLLLYLRLYDKFWRWQFWRKVEQNQEVEMKNFDAKLIAPDWQIFRKHLKREVPKILKMAYQDAAFIKNAHSLDGQTLKFLPIMKRPLELSIQDDRYFPFAELREDSVFLKPGRNERNAVFRLPLSDDATGIFEELSPSIEEFLGALGFAPERTESSASARLALNQRNKSAVGITKN